MAGKVNFDSIEIGQFLSRPALAKYWGYNGHNGFSKGVFTPKESNIIVLFVTKEKELSSTQYEDYISDDFLYWEGEEKGANNQRIIDSRINNEEIHLFYRHKHHQEFRYCGLVKLLDFTRNESKPYEFIFEIIGGRENISKILVSSGTGSKAKETERLSNILSRIGQGKFRIDLFNIWKSCSVTNIQIPEILKASHIKPWKDSNDIERLDPYNGLLLTPNMDSLFDFGFITFENDGQIELSKKVNDHIEALHLYPEMKLRNVFVDNIKYLEYHRDKIFLK